MCAAAYSVVARQQGEHTELSNCKHWRAQPIVYTVSNTPQLSTSLTVNSHWQILLLTSKGQYLVQLLICMERLQYLMGNETP